MDTATAAPAKVTLYFTACRNEEGQVRVMCNGYSYTDADRKEAQMYVNRNNMAARRRGDDSKPYRLLSYSVPA